MKCFTQIYLFYIIYYSRLYVVSGRRTSRLPREAPLWPGEGQLPGLLEERHHRIPPQVPRLAHHYQRYHRSPRGVIDYTGVIEMFSILTLGFPYFRDESCHWNVSPWHCPLTGNVEHGGSERWQVGFCLLVLCFWLFAHFWLGKSVKMIWLKLFHFCTQGLWLLWTKSWSKYTWKN